MNIARQGLNVKTKIYGTGSYIPKRIVLNDDLSHIVDTSDEWISKRTGIRERRIADERETTVVLATEAAKAAIDNAGINPEEIGLIITATSSPDNIFPSTAALVQSAVGAGKAMSFDLSAACTGFVYALSIADAYIKSGTVKKALVIGAETMSREVDWKDRGVCVLFGDGAGAVIIGESDDTGISDTYSVMYSDGSKGNVLVYNNMNIKSGTENSYIHMDGQEVFRFAVKKVPESVEEVLEKSDTDKEDIKYFVLHQANMRIIEAVSRRLGVDMDRIPVNLDKYGNTSSASIPVMLDELNRQHKLEHGDKLVISGFGAGLCWGSMLLSW